MKETLLENNLQEIEKQIWLLLQESVKTAKSAFHQGIIATINNYFPEQRTVVLRNINLEEKTLRFHTDIRSEKINHLRQNDALSWLFYDAELKLQLRIYTKATIHHTNDIADRAWENSRLASKMCYTTQAKSGSILSEPEMIDVNKKDVEQELLDFAYNNFCVIETKAFAMDFVFLNAKGNKRGFFDYKANEFYWRQI
ncbi:pyridoxamine 5'-phosphate oxidase family protein [Emticicia sp. W12TSBA100-4]|uniref:pyridoxamine 5'-phosphate oxidase family protein n=1 Tax=Emticicia sp. W12TSBA100-4 TaxID=3160965 RepID=UPI0033059A3D